MSTTAEAKLECCAISGGSRWASSSSAWPWPSPSRWPSHRAIARRQRSSPCLGRPRRSPRPSARLAGTTPVLTRATAASGIPAEDLRTSVHAERATGRARRRVRNRVDRRRGREARKRRRGRTRGRRARRREDGERPSRHRRSCAPAGLSHIRPARRSTPPSGSSWASLPRRSCCSSVTSATTGVPARTRPRLEHLCGLPVVAAMRNVGMNGRVPPDIIEGYRALRANLFLRSGGDLPHAVIVTSAVENDGKSAVAANLASGPCREWIPRDRGVGGPAPLGAAPAPRGRGCHTVSQSCSPTTRTRGMS